MNLRRLAGARLINVYLFQSKASQTALIRLDEPFCKIEVATDQGEWTAVWWSR
jgi:hypothetical protein